MSSLEYIQIKKKNQYNVSRPVCFPNSRSK